MLLIICKVNNEMAQGFYIVAFCCAPSNTHFFLFISSVVLPTELFVGLCFVIHLSCWCNTNITNQNVTWSMTILETCIY